MKKSYKTPSMRSSEKRVKQKEKDRDNASQMEDFQSQTIFSEEPVNIEIDVGHLQGDTQLAINEADERAELGS